MMKKIFFVLCMLALVLTACNIPAPATSTPQIETPIIVPTNTASSGGVVTFNNVSFTVPLGVAQNAQGEMVPAVTDTNSPWWEVAPEHLKFTLTDYQLQDKFLQPQIFVYPADEYAKLNSNAADQIQKLKAIIAGAPLTKDAMPNWVMNAAQLMASKMQVINFQNGRGVRFLTEYAQYPAIINNRELFYLFHGLTNDGKYYIVATLPVTSSILPEDEKPESPVPAGGVPAQGIPNDAYYEAVTKALDAMYEDSFNPSLFQLDALIQSIAVTP
ncbi:MAG TPA: hypothetical protein VK909_12085 [Anaerolineales bacterium]|nr:hypothetical protein [Anaerolineales bacterium]